MERHESKYSIIRYCPDLLKGEVINIGVIIEDVTASKIHYKILKHTNPKIKSLFTDSKNIDLYKVNYDFITYFINQGMSNQNLFNPDSSSGFMEHLTSILPKQIKISESTFALTESPERLLKIIMETYIGEEFLMDESLAVSNVKKYVKEVFDNKELLDKKVKANTKVYPIKNKRSINFQVDFIYKNGIFNFMQAAPNNNDTLRSWFHKLFSFIETYKGEAAYYVLYDSLNTHSIDTHTFYEMTEYLKEITPNHQFKILDVHSEEFVKLCEKIENDGQIVENFIEELVC